MLVDTIPGTRPSRLLLVWASPRVTTFDEGATLVHNGRHLLQPSGELKSLRQSLTETKGIEFDASVQTILGVDEDRLCMLSVDERRIGDLGILVREECKRRHLVLMDVIYATLVEPPTSGSRGWPNLKNDLAAALRGLPEAPADLVTLLDRVARERQGASSGQSVKWRVGGQSFGAVDLSTVIIRHPLLPMKIPACLDFAAMYFDPPATARGRARALERHINDLTSRNMNRRITAARRIACWPPDPSVDRALVEALKVEVSQYVAAEVSLAVAIRKPRGTHLVFDTATSSLDSPYPDGVWELATISITVLAAAIAASWTGLRSDRATVSEFLSRLRLVPGQSDCADEIEAEFNAVRPLH